MSSFDDNLRSIITRLDEKNSSVWNNIAAHGAKSRNIPTGFAHYPEPRTIGSFDIGQQLKAGEFFFAGELAQATTSSIWSITPPSAAFTAEMQGFGWLDDLAAVGDGEARRCAQTWVLDWVKQFGHGTGPGWTPALAGQRVIRICANGKFLFHKLDTEFSTYLYASIAKQLNYLGKRWHSEAEGRQRLDALAGLIFAGVSFKGRERSLKMATKAIGAESARIIGENGGIATRNPEELMEIFALLTWVFRTLEDVESAPDVRMINAMERIAPTLRNLRLGDSTLTRFHGGGRGVEGRLDQVLSDSRIRKTRAGTMAMGYERLTSARITLLVDCARPPTGAASLTAHASTLAFEMSSGRHPMIVNCGAGQKLGHEWERVCRETVAHNTVTIEGESSSMIAPENYSSRVLGERLLQTPTNVTRKRNSDQTGNWLIVGHDGYGESHGLIHDRHFFLSPDGTELRGQDCLTAVSSGPPSIMNRDPASFTARFHIHPDVKSKISDTFDSITLQLPNQEVWIYRQEGGKMTLDDSVYLDQWRLKPRATKQIVVTGDIVGYAGQITWIFKRVKDGTRFASTDRDTTS